MSWKCHPQVFWCELPKTFWRLNFHESLITSKVVPVFFQLILSFAFSFFNWSEVNIKMLFVVPRKLLNAIGKHPEKVQNRSDRIRFLIFVFFLHLNLVPLVSFSNVWEKHRDLNEQNSSRLFSYGQKSATDHQSSTWITKWSILQYLRFFRSSFGFSIETLAKSAKSWENLKASQKIGL